MSSRNTAMRRKSSDDDLAEDSKFVDKVGSLFAKLAEGGSLAKSALEGIVKTDKFIEKNGFEGTEDSDAIIEEIEVGTSPHCRILAR